MKILIIRFSSLGDLILLSPIFREVKRAFPNATLSFITSQEFQMVHKDNPYLDYIYLFNRKGGVAEILGARKFIKQQKFDIIIDSHYSLRSFLIRFGNKAKKYLYSKRRWERYSLIYFKNRNTKEIKTQRYSYLEFLQKYLKNINSKTEFFIKDRARDKIEIIFAKYLLDPRKMILIAPGARYINKCWIVPHWIKLIGKLKQQKKHVVLIGTKQDRLLLKGYTEIVQQCDLDLTGQLSLEETAALLVYSRVVVCNDSAILHLSEAVKTPVVTIFGPTAKEFGFAPFLAKSILLSSDVSCSPCSAHGKKKCSNKVFKECMVKVTPLMVFEAIQKVTGMVTKTI